VRARRGGDAHGVAHEVFGDGHLADDIMEAQHVRATEERFDGRGWREVVWVTTATSSSSGSNPSPR